MELGPTNGPHHHHRHHRLRWSSSSFFSFSSTPSVFIFLFFSAFCLTFSQHVCCTPRRYSPRLSLKIFLLKTLIDRSNWEITHHDRDDFVAIIFGRNVLPRACFFSIFFQPLVLLLFHSYLNLPFFSLLSASAIVP